MTQPPAGTGTGPAPYDATTSVPPVGRFVWHDLMSTDPARSAAFFGALLGWAVRETDMGALGPYSMFVNGEQPVGGVVPFEATDGAGSHWVSYLTVASVDGTCERMPALGGTVCVPPTDIPGIGRFAVVEDPTGAIVSPFTAAPGQEEPEPTAAPAAGTFCWDELMVGDVERAKAFYAHAFGWHYDVHPMGPDANYWIAKRGPVQAAGLMQLPADELPPRPSWTPYIAVDSVDASAARAAELGAQVVVQPTDIPGIGRFAMLLEPTGAIFALFRGS